MRVKPPTKKIGDVAMALRTTTRALRFYEEEGLIVPIRTPKGTRLYSDHDVTRLRVILLLVAADVPIQTIQELSTVRSKSRTGNAASRSISRLLNKLRETVVEKKNRYAELERELDVTDKIVQQCFDCPLKPTRETCFSCTVVPDFRSVFMVKLIAQQDAHDTRKKAKQRQRP
jgi:DNA-binding transcriptional MerR regulator